MDGLMLLDEPLDDSWCGEGESCEVWPEVASACLFALSALLAALALARAGRPSYNGQSPVMAGVQRRRALVAGLLVANAVRCLSLCVEVAIRSGARPSWATDDDQLRWGEDLARGLPSMVFLSAFSVVVLFWVQLHWTSNMVPVALLDCVFICANVLCYLLVTAVALCSFLFRAYSHLRMYLMTMIGLLDASVALSFAYYGLKVLSELSETASRRLPGRRIAPRVAAISLLCPPALLVRSACYLLWSVHVGRPSRLAELGLQLSSEWLPSVLALAVLNPVQLGSTRDLEDTLDDSADSEEPLLPDGARDAPTQALPSSTGLKWKQIYPQPAHS